MRSQWNHAALIAAILVTILAATAASPQSIYFKKDYITDDTGRLIAIATPLPSDQTAPSVPAGLNYSNLTLTSVTLQWGASTETGGSGLAGYKVYRGNLPVAAVTGTSFTDSALQPDTSYTYTVVAFDGAGNHSSPSGSISFTTSTSTPAAPSNLTASPISTSQINLSWTDNSNNENGFKVERKTGAGGTWSQVAIVGANVTSYPDTGLSSSTTYYYRVRSYGAGGDSAYSNEASATTFAPPRSVLNFTGFEMGTILTSQDEWTTVGTTFASIQSATKRTGKYAFKYAGGGSSGTGWVEVAGVSASTADKVTYNVNTAYIRFYLNVARVPTNNPVRVVNSIRFLGAEKLAVRLTTSGTLEVLDSTGASIGTGSTVLNTGQWYRIEVKVGTGSAAAYELRISGGSELSGTANLLTSANVSVNIGNRTGVTSNAVYFIDDVQIQDDDWPGDGAVLSLRPTANGTYTAWTGDYTGVNDLVRTDGDDGDATYVSSVTSGNKQSLTLEQLGEAVGPTSAVKAAFTVRDLSNGTGSWRVFIRSGSTDSQNTANFAPLSSYGTRFRLLNTDPNNGNSWTKSGVNAIEVGVLNNGGSTLEKRITLMGLMVAVDYAPSAPAQSTKSIVNFTGFEMGTTSASRDEWTGSATTFASIQSTTKRTGNYAFKYAGGASSGTGWVELAGVNPSSADNLIYDLDTIFIRFYLNVASAPTNNPVRVIHSIRSIGAEKLAVRLTTSGTLEVLDSTGASVGTGSTVLTTGQWYRIEVKVGTGTSAPYELRIGGATEVSGTANLLASGNVAVDIGNRTSVVSNAVYYIDDVQVQDDDWPGEGSVLALRPNGNGTYSAWTGGYTDVDDLVAGPGDDGDTSYVSSTASGDKESVTLEDLGVGPISAVKAVFTIRDLSNGSGAWRVFIRSGSFESRNTANFGPSSSYGMRFRLLNTDPNTGDPWTTSAVNAAEVGVFNNGGSTSEKRSTLMGLMVAVGPEP